ncbi:MAG: hypothetical protein U1A77_12835 [Pirellulales bacterium]
MYRLFVCVVGLALAVLLALEPATARSDESAAASRSPIHANAERELAQRLAFLNARLTQFSPGWLSSTERLDQAFGRPGPAWLRSEHGERTWFVIRQIEGGRETRYLVVTRHELPAKTPAGSDALPVDSSQAAEAKKKVYREWLWPATDLPPTDIVYDITDELLHGKAKPILCDLADSPVRVFALLPTQVERLSLRATQTVAAGQSLRAIAACGDASDRVVMAMLPLYVSLVRPNGSVERELRSATQRDGQFTLDWIIPTDAPLGAWKLIVHSQLNGLEVALPIQVTRPVATTKTNVTDAGIGELTSRGLWRDWRPKPMAWRDP